MYCEKAPALLVLSIKLYCLYLNCFNYYVGILLKCYINYTLNLSKIICDYEALCCIVEISVPK